MKVSEMYYRIDATIAWWVNPAVRLAGWIGVPERHWMRIVWLGLSYRSGGPKASTERVWLWREAFK